MEFVDREADIERLNAAFSRKQTQFVVIYGRRRIGKSTLIKRLMRVDDGDVYFLSDQTAEANQRYLLAKAISGTIEGFDKVIYPDWQALFESLNRQLTHRIKLCLDEFPYMAKSCPALTSVIQKLLNGHDLKYDMIICGSSQQLMQGYVLNTKEPLYGLANEIIKLQPIPAAYLMQALSCTAEQAVEEYAVWGGIPRYWELRSEYPDLHSAIKYLLLDPQGILAEEPQRLLRDDLRETVQTSTILSMIGNGVHRSSEIASRIGREANSITEPLGVLRELGFVRREVPFDENERTSKRGLYHISDPLTSFHYRFIAPHRSLLELGRVETVMQVVEAQFNSFVGERWEELCRGYVSGNVFDGIAYKMASRWWGKLFSPELKIEGKMVELDIVAESFDKKHILIGECKWTHAEDASRLLARMQDYAQYLPFVKRGQKVHFALFLREQPVNADGVMVMLPEDVIAL